VRLFSGGGDPEVCDPDLTAYCTGFPDDAAGYGNILAKKRYERKDILF
jgi:hypothetical protein